VLVATVHGERKRPSSAILARAGTQGCGFFQPPLCFFSSTRQHARFIDNLSITMEGARFNKAKLQACLEQDRFRFHSDVWKGIRELQIDLNDALYVLRHGTICEEPVFDGRFGQWRFTVQGTTVDERELRIGFAFMEIDGVLVLTILTE
jgi:hypothetical protein